MNKLHGVKRFKKARMLNNKWAIAALLVVAGLAGVSSFGLINHDAKTSTKAAHTTNTQPGTDSLESISTSTNPEVANEAPIDKSAASAPAVQPSLDPTTCQKSKADATNKYDKDKATEAKRHNKAKNDITEDYSDKGKAFSREHKAAQSREDARYTATMKKLEANYKKKLAELGC
jgi:hypothetical protein